MLDTEVLVALLVGAGIALVTSVVVTVLQARQLRRTDTREASRSSARSLMSAFISERDSDDQGENFLSEAEMTVMAMSDRKTRDRLRDLIRLLRERNLPEFEELSGVKAERARRLLCDHALEVLGTYLRAERLPEVPAQVQSMLSVEEEALRVRSGEVSTAQGEPIAKSAVTERPRHTDSGAARRKTASKPAAKSSGKNAGKSATKTAEKSAEEAKREKSAFWDDE